MAEMSRSPSLLTPKEQADVIVKLREAREASLKMASVLPKGTAGRMVADALTINVDSLAQFVTGDEAFFRSGR